MSVSILAQDLRSSYIVAVAGGQSGGAFQHFLYAVEPGFPSSQPQHGVFHNGVLHTGFPQLLAQSSVVCHVDALVVHNDTGYGILELLCQIRHKFLLFAENGCAWHK